MRKILILLMVLCCSIALFGCSVSPTQPESIKGYGNAVDGTVSAGSWELKNSVLSSKDKNVDSAVIFKDGTMSDYELSCKITLTGTNDSYASKFGGYAYYLDEENAVDFIFDEEEKLLTINTVKGYDVQTVYAFYDSDLTAGADLSVTKIGSEFQFVLDDELLTVVNESYSDNGQVGFITKYANVSFANVQVNSATAFDTGVKIYEQYTAAVGMPGTWDINGSTVTRTDTELNTACFESVVFNSAVVNNYSFKATVKQTDIIAGDQQYTSHNLYGFMPYYQNASNYAIVFFNGDYLDVYTMVMGKGTWTGSALIPNKADSGIHVVSGYKFGNTLSVYVNDVFVRELTYTSWNRPGCVGFDTNGANAQFEVLEVKTINAEPTIANYDASTMILAGDNGYYLEKEGNKWTTTHPFAGAPANYNFVVYASSAIMGNCYTFTTKLDMSHTANTNNYIGIYGGIDGTSNVALLLDGYGYCDLYGTFSDKLGNEVLNTFAGRGLPLPQAAYEGESLKTEIEVSCTYDGTEFVFYVEGVEMYRLELTGFVHSAPGIAANYVGAGFTIIG